MSLAIVTCNLFTWGNLSQSVELHMPVEPSDVAVWGTGMINVSKDAFRIGGIQRGTVLEFNDSNGLQAQGAASGLALRDNLARKFAELATRL